jgi:hypothetical protein
MIIMVDDHADLLWVVDDRPSRRFPIDTRGNPGEVYSPGSWASPPW